jgi:murein L,D-transpeptidase YcbB/YkuD
LAKITETLPVITVVKKGGSSVSGPVSKEYLKEHGIILANTAPVQNSQTSGTCAPNQILTQNLKAGARNGKYHAYTKAVVTEVKILQAHMNRLGFKSGAEDGILGPITDGAIKRMQTFLGTKADGYVGPITRGLINKSCGSAGLQKS